MRNALIALVPSAGVGVLFYFVVKAMIEADRRERTAHARWDKEHPVEAVDAGRARPAPDTDAVE
jgi:hypothetical protein